MNLRIMPPDGILEATISLPTSKSLSNRALILRALTPGGKGSIDGLAQCDDTDVLSAALSQGPDVREVNIGAAGTAMRFLTAYYATLDGCDVVLDGSERMRHRPISALVDALRQAGADIEYAAEEGFPPLHIRGHLLAGGEVKVKADISSQYISALLMTGPLMANGLTLTLEGEIASRPYILMTLGMMAERGVEAEFYGNTITVPAASYRPGDFTIEGDWSAAAFWYEIAAVSSGFVGLNGIKLPSLQGDSVVSNIYTHLGINTEDGEEEDIDLLASPDQDARLNYDFSDCPDLAQAVITTCALLGIPFRFTGLHSLRIKETDRIEAMRRELLKIGVPVTITGDDLMEWEGKRTPVFEMPNFDTYDDHRMAMALAAVSIFIPGIIINDAEVVSKSYPTFWDDLRNAGFTVIDASEPYEEEAAREAAQ